MVAAHLRCARPAPQRAAASCSAASPSAQPAAPLPAPSRRALLALVPAALSAAGLPAAAPAAPVPPPPALGDCADCAGAVNDTLNACNLEAQSCVSTLNDDELHFAAPWQFDGTPDDAVARLVDVATGGAYDPGLIQEPFGIRRQDAAAYIAGGVLAVLQNKELPAQPKRQQRAKGDFVPFDGALAESRAGADGSRYVRITFGTDGGRADAVDDPSAVVDAEFLFLANDNVVNIRAASRAEPTSQGLGGGGELALSFTQGLVVDRNAARRRMEALRAALRWELVPVLTDFDASFNPEAPLWVDRFFRPFDERNDFKPSGVAYPVE